MDYKDLAKKIVDAIEDKDNISFVQHCATRLRFTVKSGDTVDTKKIADIEGVMGAVFKGGQIQLIIGPDVANLYKEVIGLLPGKEGGEVDDNGNAIEKKEKLTFKSAGNAILSAISGSIVPLIPIIVVTAMFKTIGSILGPTMLGVITAESDFYRLCAFIGDAGLYFMPIFLGYSAGKYFKCSIIMSMLMAAIMIHPTLISIVNAAEPFTVYGIPMTLVNYANSSLPIILIVFILSKVEKFVNKYVPKSLKFCFVPLFTIAIMVPIALCVIGPLGTIVSTWYTNLMVSIGESSTIGRIIVEALSGGLWNVLVLCGMHLTYYMAGLVVFIANGFEGLLFPGTSAASAAVFGMTLGAFLRIKKKEVKSEVATYLFAQGIGAVTEPAIFGVGIKYKKPFLFACIGGALGGIYCAITNTATYGSGLANFTVFAGFAGSTTANFVNGAISIVIAIVASAVLTYFFGIPEELTKNEK